MGAEAEGVALAVLRQPICFAKLRPSRKAADLRGFADKLMVGRVTFRSAESVAAPISRRLAGARKSTMAKSGLLSGSAEEHM